MDGTAAPGGHRPAGRGGVGGGGGAIILDEPTAFLDVAARVTVMGLLRRLSRDRGLTVVVSTHDLELALRIADRIWLLAPDGRLVCGIPQQLTLDGAIAAAFEGTGLAFDPRAGAFTLLGDADRTVVLTADGLHRHLLERALTREGWKITTDASADLHITWDGTGGTADHNGARHRFATLADLTRWARHPAPGRTVKQPR